MRRWRIMLAAALVAGGLGGSHAIAADSSSAETVDPVEAYMAQYHLHPAFEKFGRGVSNALGGWLEFPLNIQKRYTPHDAATSLITGAAIGVVKGLVRTGVGVYETVTFLLPYPEDFAPILPTLDYFKQHEPRQEPLLLQ